jgi:hypothetical protein
MALDDEETIGQAKAQGLYQEYQSAMKLVDDAVECEDSDPREALRLYRDAVRLLEASGASKSRGGGPSHALFEMHQRVIYRAGEVMRRTGLPLPE